MNNPIVTRTNGNERMVMTGLTMALTAENIKPDSKNVATAVGALVSVSLPNSLTEIHNPNEQINQRMANVIAFSTVIL